MKLGIYIAAALTLVSGVAIAQEYPSRPIEIVVPFGPGGGADISARLLAPELKDILGTNVVVRNVTGASGTVGLAQVSQANSDGYTLGIAPIGPATTQPHIRELPYGVESFEYICNLMLSPLLLMTNADAGLADVDDFIAQAKANPGKLAYASPGAGSIPHLAMLSFTAALGLDMKHIPQNGFENTATNVTQVIADTTTGVKRFQLVPLATFADERLGDFPDTPTLEESDLSVPGFGIWFGLVAPAGTPADVVATLSQSCGEGAGRDTFIEKMANASAPVHYMNSADFTAFVQSEFEKNGALLKAAGVGE